MKGLKVLGTILGNSSTNLKLRHLSEILKGFLIYCTDKICRYHLMKMLIYIYIYMCVCVCVWLIQSYKPHQERVTDEHLCWETLYDFLEI